MKTKRLLISLVAVLTILCGVQALSLRSMYLDRREEFARQVTQAVARAPEKICAFLMEKHGILVMGETAEECFNQAELVEDTAKIAVFDRLFQAG